MSKCFLAFDVVTADGRCFLWKEDVSVMEARYLESIRYGASEAEFVPLKKHIREAVEKLTGSRVTYLHPSHPYLWDK